MGKRRKEERVKRFDIVQNEITFSITMFGGNATFLQIHQMYFKLLN